MPKFSILIIEDEKNIQTFMRKILIRHDYRVLCADAGTEGLSLIRSQCPDLVLLDLGLPDMNGNQIIQDVRTWSSIPIIVISARSAEREKPDLILLDVMLPNMDGFSVCKKIRETSSVPILMITAREEEVDKVLGLELGADDYITKPFGTSELLARIRTSLRHSNRMHTDQELYIKAYRHDKMTLDFSKRLLTLEDEPVHLTPVEYKIVAYLAQNSGKVVTYASILSNVWGPYADDDNKILRVNMANIRRKLELDPAQPHYIFTEVGVGYRMAEDDGQV